MVRPVSYTHLDVYKRQDLGRKYDLVRNADGEWCGVTDPLTQGFHYYFLIIDGISVG